MKTKQKIEYLKKEIDILKNKVLNLGSLPDYKRKIKIKELRFKINKLNKSK